MRQASGVYIVINADDLGISVERDQGLLSCVEYGVVSSTTVLPNGINSVNAVTQAMEYAHLGIGLHVNLTEGPPLCPYRSDLFGSSEETVVFQPETVSSLVLPESLSHANGDISQLRMRGKFGFRDALMSGDISTSDLEEELRAQLRWFIDTVGRPPTHIDGHQHVHVLPVVALLLGRLCSELGIRVVRIPNDCDNDATFPLSPFLVDVSNQAIEAKKIYNQWGILGADAFFGLRRMGNKLSVSSILDTVYSLYEKATFRACMKNEADPVNDPVYILEVMVHPGYCSSPGWSSDENSFSLSPDRQHEMDILTDPALNSALKRFSSTALTDPTALTMATLCNFANVEGLIRERYLCPSFGNPVRLLNIAILAQNLPASGNRATSERLLYYLSADRHSVSLFNTCDNHGSSKALNDPTINVVFAIHALRAGYVLKDVSRYDLCVILILGGTDLTNTWNEDEIKIIDMTVQRALVIVSFSIEMHARARKRWPKFQHKMMLIPASVGLTPINPDASLSDLIEQSLPTSLSNSHSSSSSSTVGPHPSVFLMLGGIRPVKDVLFIVDAFVEWRQQLHYNGSSSAPLLLIVGPVLDADYAESVRQRLMSFPLNSGVLFLTGERDLGVLPCVARKLISEASAVVNTSVAEGLPTVILDSMYLGTPVIARRSPGNVGLVTHDRTGLLFDTPSDFTNQLQRLLTSPTLRSNLISNARQFVVRHHNGNVERRAYQNLTQYVATPVRH